MVAYNTHINSVRAREFERSSPRKMDGWMDGWGLTAF